VAGGDAICRNRIVIDAVRQFPQEQSVNGV
jgi:hypothetical protein